jgi:hypothetical protein
MHTVTPVVLSASGVTSLILAWFAEYEAVLCGLDYALVDKQLTRNHGLAHLCLRIIRQPRIHSFLQFQK